MASVGRAAASFRMQDDRWRSGIVRMAASRILPPPDWCVHPIERMSQCLLKERVWFRCNESDWLSVAVGCVKLELQSVRPSAQLARSDRSIAFGRRPHQARSLKRDKPGKELRDPKA